jgi:hypothetical protein
LRHFIVAAASLGLLFGGLAACGSSGSPSASSGAGQATGGAGAASGSGSGTGLGNSGVTTGATGSAGSGVTGGAGTTGAPSTGASGTTSTAGATMSATSGATGAGAGGVSGAPGAGTDAGSSIEGGGLAACAGATDAIFCDGFEQYPVLPAFDAMGNLRDFVAVGSPPTMPTWLAYHFHGPPYIDNTMPYTGKQEYELNTETGHPAAADIIQESPDGVDLWPAAHYGRVMLQMKAVPAKGPFALMSESGLLPGGTMNESQYTLGSVNGNVAWIYTQRVRPYKNSVSTPTMRLGGNWETPAQAPTTLCTVGATSEAIPAGKWVCVEWMIDRTKPELHLWLDGVAQTEVDVVGSGGTCSAGTAATWTGPEHFTELDLGFEMWGNDGGPGAWFAWYDDFAIGTQRLGCPTP